MWVLEGIFQFMANSCTGVPSIVSEYEDNTIHYYANDDVIPADGSTAAGSPPSFTGTFEIDLRSGVVAEIDYTVTASVYNVATGQWDQLYVTIDRVHWERGSYHGHCTPTPDSFTFDRVTPRYW